MCKKRKPFFKNNRNASDIQSNLGRPETSTAIRSLISFKIERRTTGINSSGNSIALVIIHIAQGLFYALIMSLLLIYLNIDDRRTLLLFLFIFFIYGFFTSLFTELYITPFVTNKILSLAVFVFLFILANLVSGFFGFSSIPW